MRSSITEGLRNAYLADRVTPSVRATIRQVKLDAGAELHNVSATLNGQVVGDDYFDTAYLMPIWGSVARSAVSPYQVLQLVTPAAYTAGGSESLYRRYVELGGTENWNYSSVTEPASTSFKGYTRIGLHSISGSANFYVWYVDGGDDLLYRITYNPSTGAWSGKTAGYELGGTDPDYISAAIHPIDEDGAIAFYYNPPFLYAQMLQWTGSEWYDLDPPPTQIVKGTAATDIHWSGAAMVEDLAYGFYDVITAVTSTIKGGYGARWDGMNQWGFAAPREILPSSEWGDSRARIANLTYIDDRVWGIASRWMLGTDEIPYARHIALVSSADGRNWRDEGYLFNADLRATIIYNSGDDYVYLIGNASVARAEATSLFGDDPDTKKYVIAEARKLTVNYQGPGSAHDFTIEASAVNGSGLDDLLVIGNEVDVELGTNGEYGAYCTGEILDFSKDEDGDGNSSYSIKCGGKLTNAIGKRSYTPLGARMYEGPYSMYSDFQFTETMTPRLTVRQISGNWVAHRRPELGRYSLWCKKAGLALIPQSIESHRFFMRTTVKARVSWEGIYFIFWYQDEDNYFECGVRKTPAPEVTHELVITQVLNGEATTVVGDNLWDDHLWMLVNNINIWVTLQLQVGHREVFLSIHEGKPEDYEDGVSKEASTRFALDDGSLPMVSMWMHETPANFDLEEHFPPEPHNVGLRVEGFTGYEGAQVYGVVDESDRNYIVDNSATFANLGGKWLKVGEQERQVSTWTTTKIIVSPDFATAPLVNEEYGIYDKFEDGGLYPQALFSDLFLHTGEEPWSVHSILENMLELSGVALDDDKIPVANLAPLASTTAYTHNSIDVHMNLTASPIVRPTLYLWATNTNTSGQYHFSGLKLIVNSDSTELWRVRATGSSPYYQEELIAEHWNLEYPNGMFHVCANTDYISVHSSGALIAAFPVTGLVTGGYISVEDPYYTNADYAYLSELREVIDSWIWETGEQLSSALSKLLKGRRIKFVEGEDGRVGIGRYEEQGNDIDPYTSNVVSVSLGKELASRVALIEITGATDRGYLFDRGVAREIGRITFSRLDNDTILGGPLEVMEEARREQLYIDGEGSPETLILHAPDPALQLEDWWVDPVTGDERVVHSISMAIAEGGKCAFKVTTRKRNYGVNNAVWGDGVTYTDALFNDDKEYS